MVCNITAIILTLCFFSFKAVAGHHCVKYNDSKDYNYYVAIRQMNIAFQAGLSLSLIRSKFGAHFVLRIRNRTLQTDVLGCSLYTSD